MGGKPHDAHGDWVMSNIVQLPQAVESMLTSEARKTAQCMCLVPADDGGCQFEIHVGGFDVELEIAADGKIKGIYFGRFTGRIDP